MRLLAAFELMSVSKRRVESEKQLDLATRKCGWLYTIQIHVAIQEHIGNHWNLILLDDVLIKVNELLNLVSERSLREWLDVSRIERII